VVDSALIPATEHWKLADALATTLSDANVQVLTILGAVHLPYAKPASDSVVYYASLGGAGCEDLVPSASFQPLDADWEIKDSFLSSLLHLLAVERSMTVQLLLAKGYRPGRNLSGTYEVGCRVMLAQMLSDCAADLEHRASYVSRLPRRSQTRSRRGRVGNWR
jgi:hypothetical protein